MGKREALTGLVEIFLLHLFSLLRICLPHLMESAFIDQSSTKEKILEKKRVRERKKNNQTKSQKTVFVAVVLLCNSHYVMSVGAN